MSNFSLGSTINCCKGCNNRRSGCHSSCPEYLKQKSDNDSRLSNSRKLDLIYASRDGFNRWCDKNYCKTGRTSIVH